VIGDASSCGLPKAGHVANQEAKICADATDGKVKVASNGSQTVVNGAPATPTEAASINGDNFEGMCTWFKTLMGDTTG